MRYAPLVVGLVAEMEERDAAVFAQYDWDRWTQLTWYARAKAIAHFRLHHLIDLHRNDAAAREMKNRADRERSKAR